MWGRQQFFFRHHQTGNTNRDWMLKGGSSILESDCSKLKNVSKEMDFFTKKIMFLLILYRNFVCFRLLYRKVPFYHTSLSQSFATHKR